MPFRVRLWLALGSVYLIWGSTYLAIKFAVETLPPFLMAGVRFLVAGGLMYGVLRLRGAARPKAAHWRGTAIVGLLLLVGGNGGVVWAEQRIASGLAALVIATEPLWVVLIDWARPGGRPPQRLEIAGLLVGFAGAAFLVSPVSLGVEATGIDAVGVAVLLFASISWASGSVYSRHIETPDSQFLAVAMKMLVGGAVLFALAGATGEFGRFEPSTVSVKSAVSVAYLIVFGALIGFTAYIWLLKNTTLAKASTYAYVNPLVAVALGWWLASEPLTIRVVIAAGAIVTSVVLITSAKHPMPGGATG